jgi:hypothetical protein
MISWFRRKQMIVALITIEAEYIAVCSANSEAMWLQKLLRRLFDLKLEATYI